MANSTNGKRAKPRPAKEGRKRDATQFAELIECRVCEDPLPLSSLLDSLADLLIDNAEADGSISACDGLVVA